MMKQVFIKFVFTILLISPAISFAQQTHIVIGQDKQTIDEYIDHFGVPSGLMGYTSLIDLGGIVKPVDHGAGVNDFVYLHEQYPQGFFQIALYLVGDLDAVINHARDEALMEFAQWAKEVNKPIYFRVGYEFDYTNNYYQPDKYKQAFQYIVNFLREQQVSNVYFVWHSAIMTTKEVNWMAWYPGDEYVDWFGISFFNSDQYELGVQFAQLAQKHNKPLMIAEATPFKLTTAQAKKKWFQDLFRLVEEYDVSMLCYINSNWEDLRMFQGQGWGDARIQMSKELTDFWKEKIKEKRYIHY